MKKRPPLNEQEIESISALLLSEIPESANLGYELIKQNKAYTDQVLKELVLIVLLGNHNELIPKVRSYLTHRYGESGEYAEWKRQWALFKSIDSFYQYKPKVKELLDAHEEIRLQYRPYILRNRYYARQYHEVARILQYRLEQHFDLAGEYYETALGGNPTDNNTWFNLGHLCQNHFKDAKRSEFCYREALKYDPNMAAAYNNIAVLHVAEQGDYVFALEYYQKAVDLAPHYDFYRCNLASTYLKLGQAEKFEEMIQIVFSHDRNYNRAVSQWANYLWEYKKDYEAAEKEYRNALRYNGKDPNLLGNLGEMYADALGRYEEAFDLYVLSLEQNESLYRLTTMVYLLVLHFEDRMALALTYYQQLLDKQKELNRLRDRDLNDRQWADFLKSEAILLAYIDAKKDA